MLETELVKISSPKTRVKSHRLMRQEGVNSRKAGHTCKQIQKGKAGRQAGDKQKVLDSKKQGPDQIQMAGTQMYEAHCNADSLARERLS